MVSYMNSDEELKTIMSVVAEATAKMILIQDYVDRFKISDIRILAPIQDVERCVTVLDHILNHKSPEGFGMGGVN